MNSAGKAAVSRVFFALSPDERSRSRLSSVADDLAVRLGGRATSKETLHLTLAFVGELRQDRLPDLMAAASDVVQATSEAPAAGVVVLDRMRYWPSGKNAVGRPAIIARQALARSPMSWSAVCSPRAMSSSCGLGLRT